jgi:hypothetical protein
MERLIIAEMCAHETLPEFSVIRNEEVQQLVDDDVVSYRGIESKELAVEIQITGRRT